MKLRTDKDGFDYVVPEAGELAAFAKTVHFLCKSAPLVGGTSGAWLGELGVRVKQLLDGDAPGVQLPKKRTRKSEETGEMSAHAPGDLSDFDEPASEQPPKKNNGRPKCPECGDELSAGEVRQERTKCFNCLPVDE